MYKRILQCTLFISISLLSFNLANAQTAENRTWLTTYIGVNEVNSDNFNEHFGFRWGNDLGGALGLRYYLNKNFDAELGVFIGRVDDEIKWSSNYYNTSLLLHYKLANGSLLPESSVIQPFLSAGAGYSYYQGRDVPIGTMEDTQGLELPVGAGIDIPITKRLAITTGMVFNFTFNDDIDNDRVKSFRTPDDTPDNIILYKAGFKINLGPLDKDGDGVKDSEDVCPDVAGDPAYGGCPDSDGDMIPDYKDRCPNLAGTEATGGCPDRDGDSIIDSEDQCPDIAGSAEFNGCPDSDGDGIIDSEDQCPNVAGTEDMNGCPDSDNDGIADSEDNCPNIAGEASTGGCPDSDGDGIADRDDECPNVAGSAEFNGCPDVAVVQEVADKIIENLIFGFDEATIDSKYHEDLDELAQQLTQNKALRLSIAGHTDNVGSREYNELLSQRRADAVKQYLVEQGVSEDRITTSALGQQEPVATNETDAGRQLNRRVKIVVTIDN